MSNALETQGVVISIQNDNSPATYDPIGEVTNFSGFDGQAAEIDVTSLQSTAKEFLMGLQDFGNFQLDCNYLPDDVGQVALRASKASRAIKSIRVAMTDSPATTFTFNAYVLSASLSGGVDSKIDTSFVLRITGNVSES